MQHHEAAAVGLEIALGHSLGVEGQRAVRLALDSRVVAQERRAAAEGADSSPRSRPAPRQRRDRRSPARRFPSRGRARQTRSPAGPRCRDRSGTAGSPPPAAPTARPPAASALQPAAPRCHRARCGPPRRSSSRIVRDRDRPAAVCRRVIGRIDERERLEIVGAGGLGLCPALETFAAKCRSMAKTLSWMLCQGRSRPGQQAAGRRRAPPCAAGRMHAQPIAGAEPQACRRRRRSRSASRESSPAQAGRIAAIDNAGHTTFVVSSIVATSSPRIVWIDPLGRRGERRHVAEQEARDIEDVDAEVLDDEPLVGRPDRAGRITRRSPSGSSPAPRTACRSAPESHRAHRRIGDCQRKFSCTISGTPAASASRDHALASSSVGSRTASGRSSHARPAANSTSGAMARTVVAMSTKSSVSALSISRRIRIGAARCRTGRRGLPSRPRSRSQSATISAPPTSRHACRWFAQRSRSRSAPPLAAPHLPSAACRLHQRDAPAAAAAPGR